jgi:hypothetical protein
MVPLAPVTVTVAAPTVAVADAANVSVLAPVVGLGLNVAVTPAGNVPTLRVTLPVKPLTGVTLTALVPDPPTTTLALAADSEKLGWLPFTVRVILVVCVIVPLTPVIVTVAGPVAAEAEAVNVRVLEEVAGFGLKAAVIPAGSVPTLKVTLPVNPPTGVIVTELAPVPPCVTVAFVPESEKSAAAGTVKEMLVVWERLPLEPVTITLAVPVAAVAEAVNVRALVPVVGFGEKLTVTPDGSPLALKVTLPAKPPLGVTVIVLVAVAPRATDTVDGAAERLKSDAPGMVKARVTVWTTAVLPCPLVPVNVIFVVPAGVEG